MYFVDQKVGKHVYVYEVHSYWDKDKKSPRQQRVRIGKRDPVTGELIKLKTRRQSREYGPVYFIASLVEQLRLKELLNREFPESAREILMIAAFQIAEHKSLYLCNSWLEHIYLRDPLSLPGQSISRLLHSLGEEDRGIYRFLDDWTEQHTDNEFIVFDITSLSTYSKKIDFAEWGYNRDGERLAQVNFGVVYSEPSNMPLLYSLYPGSVPDVVTLGNIKKRLERISELRTLFVLDRGFYSTKNIDRLDELGPFLIPLPMGTKTEKELVGEHHLDIAEPEKAFRFGKEIYYALSETLVLGDTQLTAHLFYNEKRAGDEKERLIGELLTIEEEVRTRRWKSSGKLIRFLDDNWPGWQQLFSLEEGEEGYTLSRKKKEIELSLNRRGIFVLLTNTDLSAEQALTYYRRKDGVEKLFDSMKHGTELKRLRVHSRQSMEGLIFIEFISLIMYSEIQKVLRESGLGKKLTVEQLFYELKKLSVIEIDDKKPIITELTRKQKDIFNAFGIQLPILT
ncbi:MAG: IS1634 family transposase [Spirochaetota bacterium]|nr:IS1634 family transposase [Spirochaetota bacterium]